MHVIYLIQKFMFQAVLCIFLSFYFVICLRITVYICSFNKTFSITIFNQLIFFILYFLYHLLTFIICILSQFPDNGINKLDQRLLFFRHDYNYENILLPISSVSDVVENSLIEIVLSGKRRYTFTSNCKVAYILFLIYMA